MRRASLAALLLLPQVAHAAGIGRPNVGGARPIGWGGAFTAIADDPSALHHNPAGLASQRGDSVLVGAEFVVAPRSYKPLQSDGSLGEAQEPANTPNVVPTLGYVTRLGEDGVPSHLALGIGVWNTFGGSLHYEPGPEGMKAIDEVRTAVLEVVPGVAYEVNEMLQLGLSLRIGVGLFDIIAESFPADADVSGVGFGAGFALGAMLTPSDWLRIGLTYRSPLTVPISGDGQLDELGNGVFINNSFEHEQEWPAQGSLGFRFTLDERLSLSAQADWTDWSQVQSQVLAFSNGFTQTIDTDFHDSYALHLGGQYLLNETFALRGGYTFDSNAVPDRTIERQYLDGDKHAVALGGSIRLSPGWSLDLGLEFVAFPTRTIADNRDQYTQANWASRANVAPGEHSGQIYTFDLGALYRY
jgi:long-chain fatty acid transport protein